MGSSSNSFIKCSLKIIGTFLLDWIQYLMPVHTQWSGYYGKFTPSDGGDCRVTRGSGDCTLCWSVALSGILCFLRCTVPRGVMGLVGEARLALKRTSGVSSFLQFQFPSLASCWCEIVPLISKLITLCCVILFLPLPMTVSDTVL